MMAASNASERPRQGVSSETCTQREEKIHSVIHGTTIHAKMYSAHEPMSISRLLGELTGIDCCKNRQKLVEGLSGAVLFGALEGFVRW